MLGDAPSQALRWTIDALAKARTLSIVGVYPPNATSFPIGTAMNKNLALNMANCHHRKYIPMLIELVRSGAIDPAEILTHAELLSGAIEAWEAFERRDPGWIKVELVPARVAE